MKVSLKQEYRGQLGLHFDHRTGDFFYTLTQRAFPSYEPEVIEIEEGDELTIRNPHSGDVVIHRIVEFDYETGKRMNVETGAYHQIIDFRPLRGILTNIEPSYWLGMFLDGYYADLVKSV